jgi:integrase
MVNLAYKSGLRRAELANLKVGDIILENLIVREGKGKKDRTVPLPSSLVDQLAEFTRGMRDGDSVFNLRAISIGDKIRRLAREAGVNLHTHSLRHGYATRLWNVRLT